MHLDRDDDATGAAASSARGGLEARSPALLLPAAQCIFTRSRLHGPPKYCRNGQDRALPSLRELPAASHTMFETRSAKAIQVIAHLPSARPPPFTLLPLPTHSRDPPLAPASMADAVVDVCIVCPAHAAPAAAQPWSQLTLPLQFGAVRETTLNEPVQETILRDLRM
jgi:hypothetical protein